jgi:hypothetical protein
MEVSISRSSISLEQLNKNNDSGQLTLDGIWTWQILNLSQMYYCALLLGVTCSTDAFHRNDGSVLGDQAQMGG